MFEFLSGSVIDKREELVLTLVALMIPMTTFPALI